MDDRNLATYYESDETNKAGDFDIISNKYANGKALDPTEFSVRLASLSDLVCNIATDFSGGQSRVKLRQPTVVYGDLVKHVVGPFYYTTLLPYVC
ncbi:hypothetical protein RHGRI_011349 [Rhododendron griersonianum]|uniref:Uncharacterized protein n=1 Tax=Rhododendron griersonianum TaxID=479676 RepID=A0AAV6KLN1_9ERIC|nr:hypothetical protein RHGRI_011349 [Rhododendron griersonianum]